jgi:hypothetical protein
VPWRRDGLVDGGGCDVCWGRGAEARRQEDATRWKVHHITSRTTCIDRHPADGRYRVAISRITPSQLDPSDSLGTKVVCRSRYGDSSDLRIIERSKITHYIAFSAKSRYTLSWCRTIFGYSLLYRVTYFVHWFRCVQRIGSWDYFGFGVENVKVTSISGRILSCIVWLRAK